ncbi:MAG TPA: YfhO family protein [Candidatus Limnocylindria bacterium]|nr:YfhO family protein [Candidatus Limnocylindria bacterium]
MPSRRKEPRPASRHQAGAARPAPKRRSGSGGRAPAPRERPRPEGTTVAVAADRGRNRVVVLAILLAWVALFAPQIFRGQVFTLGDAPLYRVFAEFSRERWASQHERTFWNPYVFAGLPAAASLADSRPQYLPGALLGVGDAIDRIPGWPPLAIPLAAHLAGMLAAAWLARALWACGAGGMAVAGLAWGLMPNLVGPMAYGHDAQMLAGSLIPLVLLLTHTLMVAAGERRAALIALGLAAVLAFQCLRGHPQIVIYSGTLTTVFALAQARRLGRWSRMRLFGGAALLGVVLAAAVWWPALRYGAESSRGSGLMRFVLAREQADFSMAWRDVAGLIWPWSAGRTAPTYWGGLIRLDYPMYLGATACFLAVAGLVRKARARGVATGLAVGVGVAVLLSLGTNLGPLHVLLRDHVPLWSAFRVPVAVLIVAQLGVALLAARSLAPVTTRTVSARVSTVGRVAVAGSLAVLTLIGLALALGPLAEDYAQTMAMARPGWVHSAALAVAKRAGWDLVFRAVLCGAVLAAMIRWRGRSAWAGAAVALLVTIDLGSSIWPVLRGAEGPLAALERPPTRLALAAQRDSSHRVVPMTAAEFNTNDWVRWRVRSLGGGHGSYPRWWWEMLGAGMLERPPMLRALAVEWIEDAGTIAKDTVAFQSLEPPGGATRVWRVRDALPRAYAVSRVVALGSDVDVLRTMVAGFDPADVAFTTEAEAAGSFSGAGSTAIRWIVDSPDRVELDVDAQDRTFVVVADAWFKGWSATVDGREARIHRVSHMLRGVPLPAGRHRVVMRYVPDGWRPAVLATRIGGLAWILLVAVLGVLTLRRPRRPGPPAPESGGSQEPPLAAPALGSGL